MAKAIEATPWAVGFGGSQASVFTHLVQTPGRCFSTTSSACVTVVGCGLPKLRQTQGHMADALGEEDKQINVRRAPSQITSTQWAEQRIVSWGSGHPLGLCSAMLRG